MRVTAYCPCSICCGPHADGITAIGRSAHEMGVAVPPELLRSRIDIPGYGNWVYADDTGSAITTGRLDVRFSDHETAKAWGVKRLTVRVWQ